MSRKKIAVILIALGAALVWLHSIYVAPIAMYHAIDVVTVKGYESVTVRPDKFKQQMEFLKRHKYNIVTLSELTDLINSKERIPWKTICITFDDGYVNNYIYAYPVLKKLTIPATMFVISGFIGKPGYLSAEQIREMSDNGIDIGSHTKVHFWLGRKSKDEAKREKEEIVESKATLEKITAKEVKFFSYPGGGFRSATRQMVIDAGYKGAVATNTGKRYPKDDVYALKRLRISKTSDDLRVFWFETLGYYTWIKEHRDDD